MSASSTADMARLKQGGKRGAIAAEAAARKEDLEIPDVPKSEDDLKVIGALPLATCTVAWLPSCRHVHMWHDDAHVPMHGQLTFAVIPKIISCPHAEAAIKNNLLFDMLSPAARREVIDSMTPLSVPSGTRIITQVSRCAPK